MELTIDSKKLGKKLDSHGQVENMSTSISTANQGHSETGFAMVVD